MVEICEIQVCEILGEIVADRHSGCAVDYLVKKPKRVLALDFLSDDWLQHIMVDWRVELPNVYFQAVPCVLTVFHSLLDLAHRSMYATLLDAAVRVCSEDGYPYRLQHVHYGMVQDAVGIIRQTENLPFLGLEYGKRLIFRISEWFGTQHLMQSNDVRFPVPVMETHTVCIRLTTSCLFISETEVFQRDDLFVQIAKSFHTALLFLVGAFGSPYNGRSYQLLSDVMFFAKRQGRCSHIFFNPYWKVSVRADVRIRSRGGVIRVRIGETCIRPVIRIPAEQHTTRAANLSYHSLTRNSTCSRSPVELPYEGTCPSP